MPRLLALITVCLLASPAAAQLLDDPRAMGMGGAVRGDPVGVSALLYNPAGMARAGVYQANVAYVRGGASEVGRMTTASVVASIFYIIVADCVFSVLFYVVL